MTQGLKGIMPAVASPCDANDVFLEGKFVELLTNLYKQGIHGVYVCGATGDGYNMLLPERKRATEMAVEVSGQYGGKTVVHVGTSNTRDSVELAGHAADAGADAVSAMPPANRNLDQLANYYTEIARTSGLPLLVYHIPILTGTALTANEMLRLLDIEGVVGFKFSDWNLFFMRRILMQRPEVPVFNGNDEFLCPGLLYGACGGIGMNYNLFPRLFLGIYNAVGESDIGRAMDLQNRFLAYIDIIWRYGLRPSFEAVMRQRGLAPYCFRRPRQVLDEARSRALMAELGPKIAAIEEVT